MITTENVQAGPKLDALVAQDVMGWTDLEPAPMDGTAWWGIAPGCTLDMVPKYSKDPVAALLVVEKMRSDWFSFKAWQPAKESGETAVVSFVCGAGPCPRHGTDFHNHHGAYDVDAETLPLAICRAALIAVKSGGRRLEGRP